MMTFREARAAALFVAPVDPSDQLDPAQLDDVIRTQVRTRGLGGCIEVVAGAHGDDPHTAQARQRWALEQAGQIADHHRARLAKLRAATRRRSA